MSERGAPKTVFDDEFAPALDEEVYRSTDISPGRVSGVPLRALSGPVKDVLPTLFSVPHPSDVQARNQVILSSHAAAPLEPAAGDTRFRLETTHFRIRRPNLSRCCHDLKAWLLRNHCDFTFDPNTIKYDCTGYHRGLAVLFDLSVYRARDGAAQTARAGPLFVCEFLRRQGDCMQFDQLFQTAKDHLFKGIDPEVSTPGFQPRPLPKSLSAKTADTISHTGVTSLVKMASSKYANVHREGVRGMVTLSFPSDDLPRLITRATPERDVDATLAALLASLASPDEEVHRCAVTALANLIEAEESKLATFNHLQRGGVQSIVALVKPSSSLEVLRESGRCLCHLTSLLEVPAPGSTVLLLRKAVSAFNSLPDEEIRQWGEKLATRLRRHTDR